MLCYSIFPFYSLLLFVLLSYFTSLIDFTSDQYSSEKYMRMIKMEEALRDLEAKEKPSTSDKHEMKRLKKEIAPLKTFLDDAASHRKAIKAEIGMFSHLFSLIHCELLS